MFKLVVVIYLFSFRFLTFFVPVELCTLCSRPKTIVNNLAKNLPKNLVKNLETKENFRFKLIEIQT